MKRLRVPAQYLPIFCRELHQLVRTGIPLAEGLTMLREDETDPDTRSWLEALCRSTEEGLPLASALRETGAFPAYMTDMVSLAEETGRLEDVLLSLQRHYDRQLRMAADIRGAVAVPVTLFAVMVAVVVLLVTQVLPVFDRVFAQLGVRMGAVATGMMNAGAVLAKAGTGLAVVLVILAAAALVVALVPSLREKFVTGFRRSFGGRGILGQMAAARFASSMSMAVASGLSMEESVALSAKLCGGAREIDEKTERCRKEIEEGGSPADALADSGLFSGRDCRLLKLAEQTGSLPDTLEDLAQRQEEESLRRIDRTVGAIEPAIVVITSALAGVILLSVMLPLMGLLSTIG
ncbi:MAG: type II secretion system F family protein [Oscillospiraceae bacterium]|jgi:type IV pilus assembly protein PilC|nr:type II secretion system F family protein [Oscillospiraceae bacterium]MDE7041505.1 type II secretion system F family protein [Oscillospiraceae bacterium]